MNFFKNYDTITLLYISKTEVDFMQRESFGSRLGFILISAGCAIGLGNVWRFPYIAGQYSGAAFILIYLLFLVIFIAFTKNFQISVLI